MTEETTDGDDGSIEYEKEVSMVAYPPEEHTTSLEEFAEGISKVDLQETYTANIDQWEFRFDLGNQFSISQNASSDLMADGELEKLEEIKKALKSAPSDVISLEHITDTTVKKKNSLKKAANHMLDELGRSISPELLDGEITRDFQRYWKTEEGRTKVRLQHASFKERRVLAKEANRDDDSLYQTLGKVPSYKLKIKLVGDSEDEIDQLTEDVVKHLHMQLSTYPQIGRVRYTDCTITTKKEGDCYNV